MDPDATGMNSEVRYEVLDTTMFFITEVTGKYTGQIMMMLILMLGGQHIIITMLISCRCYCYHNSS